MKDYGETIKALRCLEAPLACRENECKYFIPQIRGCRMSVMRKDAADAITDLQRENAELTAKVSRYEAENRWVPVTERPPVVKDDVFVRNEIGNIEIAYYDFDEDFDGWYNPKTHRELDCPPRIVAWRPLPKFEQEVMG